MSPPRAAGVLGTARVLLLTLHNSSTGSKRRWHRQEREEEEEQQEAPVQRQYRQLGEKHPSRSSVE